MLPFRAKIRTRTNADFSTLIFPRALSRLSCLLIGVCAKMFARRVLIRLFGFVARRCLLVVKRTDYSLAINWDAFVVMQRWLKRARLLWFYGEANLRYFFFFFLFVLKICINQIFKSYQLRFHGENVRWIFIVPVFETL